MQQKMVFCPHCGKQLPAGAKFCDACGTAIPQAVQTQTTQGSVTQGSKISDVTRKKGIIALVIVLIIGSFAVFGSTGDEAIVKEGHFQVNQSRSVGEAFDSYFSNTRWTSKTINGTHYVYFQGKGRNTKTNKNTIAVKATFVVYPKAKSWELTKMSIDGQDVSNEIGFVVNQIVDGDEPIYY
ncbi:MAG: zinc ribbon domain-containing protein [Selenomonadaceae bacterium]|jgi:flagellar basal body rod protein FlgG|uniref:zinc ribbon domain-containing protein n=1 Tax=Selenomonas bovis TaxID=416586 RepID=UPI0003727F8E|nr:zinc ribbon domain-containing protein [Selenomonas bovis]MCI6159275.1 zinc ribbon domain-containing protein [Selenomonadaceae bacterium]MDY2685238.1 zinc ribbon domain-containing protein [Selenomonadaceae bacterium]